LSYSPKKTYQSQFSLIYNQMVEELGYQEVGRKLGVSGNAVKKRIRNH